MPLLYLFVSVYIGLQVLLVVGVFRFRTVEQLRLWRIVAIIVMTAGGAAPVGLVVGFLLGINLHLTMGWPIGTMPNNLVEEFIRTVLVIDTVFTSLCAWMLISAMHTFQEHRQRWE